MTKLKTDKNSGKVSKGQGNNGAQQHSKANHQHKASAKDTNASKEVSFAVGHKLHRNSAQQSSAQKLKQSYEKHANKEVTSFKVNVLSLQRYVRQS